MYVEFTVSQTMEHFLACHENAWAAFGGVASRVMIDNLKSAVLQRLAGTAPVFNARYLDYARHAGFSISACNVAAGHEKGRVESGVGYVKKNFLNGLELADFSAINPAARVWLDTIANVRVHGETHRRPVELFEEERAKLRPLNCAPYDVARIFTQRASSQFRVRLDTNRYSVPAEHASARVTVKAYPDRVLICRDEAVIARHRRSYDRRQDIEDPDHPKALLAQRRNAREQRLLMQFLALSPQAQAYYEGLESRRLNPRHHLRKILALAEIYGAESTAWAIADGLAFHAFSCEYIAHLLEVRARSSPPVESTFPHSTSGPARTRTARGRPLALRSQRLTRARGGRIFTALPPNPPESPYVRHRELRGKPLPHHPIKGDRGALRAPGDAQDAFRPRALRAARPRGCRAALASCRLLRPTYRGRGCLARGSQHPSPCAPGALPLIKSLEQFNWNWPKKINRPQIQNLFRLAFLEDKANIIFLGTVGVGKSHLGIALAHTACMRGYPVLFTTAIDIVNTLSAAQATGTLKRAMNRYLRPAILLIDELGYLPIDKTGADLLFQIISGRYEHGSTVDHLQPRLQALGRNLQQRQHAHFGATGSPAPSRRDRRHRGSFLPRQRSRRAHGVTIGPRASDRDFQTGSSQRFSVRR